LPPTENRFLLDFDWSYRVRRLELLRLELHEVFKRQRERSNDKQIDPRDKGWRPVPDAQWRAGVSGLLPLRELLQRIHQELLFLEQDLDLSGECLGLLHACDALCRETRPEVAKRRLDDWCE